MLMKRRRGRGRLKIDLLVAAVVALQHRLVLHTGRLLLLAVIDLPRVLRLPPRARPTRGRWLVDP